MPHLPLGQASVDEAASVTVDGVRYSTGCCAVAGFARDEYQFGLIKNTYVIDGIPFLLCNLLLQNFPGIPMHML